MICKAEGRFVSLSGDECMENCRNLETTVGEWCVCASDAARDDASFERGKKDTLTCIASEECSDYLLDNDV